MTKLQLSVYRNRVLVSKIILNLCKWLLIIGLSFIIIYPWISMIVPSVTHILELDDPASVWIPARFSLKNLVVAYQLMSYGKTLALTVGYSLGLVIIQAFISSFVGYAFARFKFPLKKLWIAILFLQIVIPPFAISMSVRYYYTNFSFFGLIPLLTGKTINLLNQPIVYLLINTLGVGLKGGLFIFIFIKFFTNIPEELEESAFIDGAGFFRIYWQIILPNALPAVVTCVVLSFVWNYGDYQNSELFNSNLPLLPRVLINSVASTKFIPTFIERVYIYPRAGVTEIMIGAIQNAALLLFMFPILILYLFIQRKFVENFERSGIVG